MLLVTLHVRPSGFSMKNVRPSGEVTRLTATYSTNLHDQVIVGVLY